MDSKGQVLLFRVLMLALILIMVYFVFIITAPIIGQFMAGRSLSVRLLQSLVLPLLGIVFIITVFKVLRKGENE